MLQKYFIAIVPPEPVLSSIQKIKQDMFDSFGTKGALRSPGHITLHMPFSWEETKEEKLVAGLQSFTFEKDLAIQLNNYACFEPRVIFIDVIRNTTLEDLQKKLVQHVKKQLQLFNQSDDMRGFHPHITVAFRDLKKPVFYRIWEEYQTKLFSAEFLSSSFCLLKQVGQRWEVYKEFKLVK